MQPSSSGGRFPRRAPLRSSVGSAARASTCRITRNRKRKGRTSVRTIFKPGRQPRGSTPGRPARSRRLLAYHRSGTATLVGSEHDTPLHLNADRTLRRVGVLGSVTHHRGKHVIKAGAEAARLNLREEFSFFVTDEDRRRRGRAQRERPRARRGRSVSFQRPRRAHVVFVLRPGFGAVGRRPDRRFRRSRGSRDHAGRGVAVEPSFGRRLSHSEYTSP